MNHATKTAIVILSGVRRGGRSPGIAAYQRLPPRKGWREQPFGSFVYDSVTETLPATRPEPRFHVNERIGDNALIDEPWKIAAMKHVFRYSL